jgi:hypothetical protein
MRHMPSPLGSKRFTPIYFPASPHFLTRPQLLTRVSAPPHGKAHVTMRTLGIMTALLLVPAVLVAQVMRWQRSRRPIPPEAGWQRSSRWAR